MNHEKLTFDPADPRWTAYVLGELESAERAPFDALLVESDDARRLVAEITSLVGMVGQSLLAEPAPGLRPEQREVLTREAENTAFVVAPRTYLIMEENLKRSRRRKIYLSLATAAAIAAIYFCLPTVQYSRQSGPQVARNDKGEMLSVTPKIIVQEEEEAALADSNGNKGYAESTYTNSTTPATSPEAGGQTLPTPYYMKDDVTYFSPGPKFKLQKEAEALKQFSSGGRAPQQQGVPQEAEASKSVAPVADLAVPVPVTAGTLRLGGEALTGRKLHDAERRLKASGNLKPADKDKAEPSNGASKTNNPSEHISLESLAESDKNQSGYCPPHKSC